MHELAQLRGINVIAHTSSFALRRDVGDIREIGRKLNARYVLEGSLQGSAARIRITTQLIDSTSGTHLWSKSFDRPAEDIFAVQDEIAREVATALRLGVAGSERTPLRSSGTPLLGRDAEAIDVLERAMMRDNVWYHGWYLFDRDPAYVSVHTDPKFQALRAAYRARINAEQQKLAELRSAGLVAARP